MILTKTDVTNIMMQKKKMESKTTFEHTSNLYFWKHSFIISPTIVEFHVGGNILFLSIFTRQ